MPLLVSGNILIRASNVLVANLEETEQFSFIILYALLTGKCILVLEYNRQHLILQRQYMHLNAFGNSCIMRVFCERCLPLNDLSLFVVASQ